MPTVPSADTWWHLIDVNTRQDVLDEYKIDLVIGSKLRGDLCKILDNNALWIKLYEDMGAVVYLRKGCWSGYRDVQLFYPYDGDYYLNKARDCLSNGEYELVPVYCGQVLCYDGGNCQARLLNACSCFYQEKDMLGWFWLVTVLVLEPDNVNAQAIAKTWIEEIGIK